MAAVDAVRSTLDLRTPAVVGHSYGGMLAVALAADRPGSYRVAVNIDGTGFAHPDTPAALRAVWEAEAEEDPWPDVGDADWMAAEIAADQQELAAAGVPTDVVPVDFLRRGFAVGPDGRGAGGHRLRTTSRWPGDCATSTCSLATPGPPALPSPGLPTAGTSPPRSWRPPRPFTSRRSGAICSGSRRRAWSPCRAATTACWRNPRRWRTLLLDVCT